MATAAPIHIFGVRHHGPGSARSLRRALEALKPEAILIEGPPDAEDALPLAGHAELKPPVALLVYNPEKPHRGAFYPFAVFSPEWQAIQYGLKQKIPVRFMDFPQAHQLAEPEPAAEPPADADSPEPPANSEAASVAAEAPPAETEPVEIHQDPLAYLATAAGYSDSERWWEHMVEYRRDSAELFAAILEAMTALRESAIPSQLTRLNPEREARREAFMRQTIRQAEREGFARIAVVCGAWHAPALVKMPPAQADAALLKNLPKTKVVATWVPWTYGRLAAASGYGAGIESPGWYHHLWEFGGRKRKGTGPRNAQAQSSPDGGDGDGSALTIHWMARVAHLLRKEDLDASSASIIEAVRLAESLAAVRNRPLPGLPELNEATQTVLCFGDSLPLKLIHEKLIVSERLGEVPETTPMVPLQQDLQREQKRLQMKVEATQDQLELDLRKENARARSHLLHRLNLLEIPWGESQRVTGAKGTFWEIWKVQWQPEFAVKIIEAAVWGNTVAAAATARARDLADKAAELPALTQLVDRALLADLPDAVSHIMARLQSEAAVASDVAQLMAALPPLAQVLRYGNVRQTDAAMVGGIVNGLVARICIGLPGACASLNDEAAAAMFDRILEVNGAMALLQNAEQTAAWTAVLRQLADQQGVHGLLAGRCCRLLLEAGAFDPPEIARRMGLALSPAIEPTQAAAWVEGFLRGSGLLLLHDDNLWQVLDAWVCQLHAETFTALLPLLRRTFSTFTAPERRQIGERAKRGASPGTLAAPAASDFDAARAEKVLPLVAQLLGLAAPGNHS